MDDAQNRSVTLTNRRLITLLILAAVVPFAWSLGFGYVLDDTTAIRSNPDLNGWASLCNVWTHRYGGAELPFYAPIAFLDKHFPERRRRPRPVMARAA